MQKNHKMPDFNHNSFACAHCHAISHQYWHDTYTEKISSPPGKRLILNYNELDASNILKGNPYGTGKKIAAGDVFIFNETEKKLSKKIANLFVSECHSCQEITIWEHNKIIWPNSSVLIEAPNPDMPPEIKIDYEEARSIAEKSPRAAAALLRLCVEKLCENIEGKTLNDKIKNYVASSGNIKIQRALDSVRVIGNESVHPGELDLNDNRDIAQSLFKIVNFIVSEFISKDKLINEIFSTLPQDKIKGIENRDIKRDGHEVTSKN